MSERVEQAPRNRKFTKEQIAKVKAVIAADPELGRELVDSAQSGNENDLRFLMEAGFAIFSDGPIESVVRDIPKD